MATAVLWAVLQGDGVTLQELRAPAPSAPGTLPPWMQVHQGQGTATLHTTLLDTPSFVCPGQLTPGRDNPDSGSYLPTARVWVQKRMQAGSWLAAQAQRHVHSEGCGLCGNGRADLLPRDLPL